jgi:cholesterol oxidase
MTPGGLSLPRESLKSHYEVAIIGSGYGGGVAGSRLARAGRQVAIFERGREIRPGEYPDNALKMAAEVQTDLPEVHVGSKTAMFDFRFNTDMNVIVGCGLGGTSLINASIALEPEQRVFDDPHWPEAVRTASREGALAPQFARAIAMLGASPYPESAPRTEKLESFGRVAERFGKSVKRPLININFTEGPNHAGVVQKACIRCGDCIAGCNHLAKNTVLMNYLPDAAKHGAQIFTRMRLEYLERDGAAWRLHFQPVTGLLEAALPPIEITAETVILAAGTLGSTEVLLRSRDRGLALSDALGSRFSGNGDMIGFSYNGEDPMNSIGWGHRNRSGSSPVGPCSTGIIDFRDEASLEDTKVMAEASMPGALAALLPKAFAAGAKIEGVTAPRGILNSVRAKSRELMSFVFGSYVGAVRNTIIYLVVSQDDSAGRMYLDRDRVRVSWPGAGSARALAEASELVHRAAIFNGGTFLRNPVWNRFNGQQLLTGHPLGGCVMGDDATTAVVNDRGAVYAGRTGGEVHPGLYVMDGAVIPRSLGVNPLLTITAMAERSCDSLTHP